MSGEVEIGPYWMDVYNDQTWGRKQKPWKDILRTASIWYDYTSIPQLTCNLDKQENAIASIVNYVDRSDYLFILTPPLMEMQEESGIGHNSLELRHSSAIKTKTSEVIDYNTWKRRGWCALELFAMAMKTGSSAKACVRGRIIRVRANLS